MNTHFSFSDGQNRAIAMGGLLQSLNLVRDLARTGYLTTQSFEACTKSLFVTNPQKTADVYGDITAIEGGLSLLHAMLTESLTDAHKEIMTYAVGINNLSQRFLKNKKMLATVAERLDATQQKVEHFGISHDNTIAAIADIYTNTISTFPYRIHVKGEYTYLQQTRVADQIRTLLLAAIRAAILWRQNGGNIIKLIFSRRALRSDVESLLQHIRAQ